MYRFIDLFAGIGGFRVAMQHQGMECVFSSEIDEHSRQAYLNNFGERPDGDISNIRSADIPDHDILCAGFPCQPFSISGKAGGFSDQRGKLFFEIARIAEYHKPPILLLENVKNIITLDNGQVIRQIYQSLENIGYNVHHYVLNAGDFGIPQQRKRVYFVALRKGVPLLHREPIANYRKKYLKQVLLSDKLTAGLVIDRPDIEIRRTNVDPQLKPIQIGIVNKGGQGERIYSTDGHAITMSANGGGVGARTGLYLVNNKVRRLHIDEAKVVMGFNRKHFVSPGTHGYRQLGNAVIPAMVENVYKRIAIYNEQ